MKNLKLVFSQKGFMRYFKNTSWLFFEKFLRMAVGITVTVWIARYLGPEKFGLFSYAQAFVILFSSIAALGLDSIVVRELVKDERKRDFIIATAFYLKFVGALAVLAIISIAIRFTSNDHDTNVLIFIIASATIFQSFNVIDFYFQSKVMSKYVVYVNIFSVVVSSIIKIILILTEAPLIAFAWVVLFDSIVLALGLSYFYIKKNSISSIKLLKFKQSTAINLLRDSWPLILTGAVISIYMKVDQVMIKEILSVADVGQYAAAVQLSRAWYFIPMIITSSLFPAIINARKTNKKLYYERLQKLFAFMVWLAIIVAIIVTFISDWLINLLYGQMYNQAAGVLVIHIWTGIAVGYGLVWTRWLLAENLQKMVVVFHIVTLILNVAFNLYFLPIMGVTGAAFATALASLLSQLAGILTLKRDIALRFLINSLLPIKLINMNKSYAKSN